MKSTLGINVDHVATVREARKGRCPRVVDAALLAERAGAQGITVHLRQDRRHIQDRDVELLRELVVTKLNLEMSVHPEIVAFARKLVPDQATLVPENRQEITTEGGLDLKAHQEVVAGVVSSLQQEGIIVSLFIDPDADQILLAHECGADYIELHTGCYANARGADRIQEFNKLVHAAVYASGLGLGVNAGHGLDYHNTMPVAGIPEVEELNIGHAVISYALFHGLERAVRDMVAIIEQAAASREWPWQVEEMA